MEQVYYNLLKEINEDTTREGLINTPMRAAKAMKYLTSGYTRDIDEVVNGALFEVDTKEMVVVKNIRFYSLCEHHILPFFGECSVGYIPNGKVIGLSKIPRIVDMFARRLQVQERLNMEIAQAIHEVTGAEGVIVTMNAQHMCMMMRGVEKEADTTTKYISGELSERQVQEFFNMLSR